jgi:hypothetical protein
MHGAAASDPAAVCCHGGEHFVQLVVPVRCFLAVHGGRDPVTHQEDLHGDSIPFGQGDGEAKGVGGVLPYAAPLMIMSVVMSGPFMVRVIVRADEES